MDLHQWMLDDLAAVRGKLFDSVVDVVPRERWLEHADGGGSTLTHLLLHIARHQDLAVNSVVRNHDALFLSHREPLGLADAASSVGLSEREDFAVSQRLQPDALLAFVHEVFDTTQAWLEPLGSLVLDHVPNADYRLTHHGGLSQSDVPWLYSMWNARPISWLVQWPVIGHGHAHVGEGISLRNRMGLSPF
jgi:hypothetical protein